VVTRTWTATDACGNRVTASQTINVMDTEAPTFVDVPRAITIECGAPMPTEHPTATDNCDNQPRVSANERRINGNCIGNYTLIKTWTATDACGNSRTATQEITVKDTESPVLVGVPLNISLTCTQTVPLAAGVTATDRCDNNVRVVFNDINIPGNCPQAYAIKRTWIATDACGNTTSASQTVSVGDTEPPTFSDVPQSVTLQCGDDVNGPTEPTVEDNCDPNPTFTMAERRITGSCAGNFEFIRTWTATDACGNTSTVSQHVTIRDTKPPVLFSIPANVTLACGGPLPSGRGVGARDNCDNNVRIVMKDSLTPGNCPASYTILRTWTATDACGNTATASQIMTIRDSEPPIFAGVPANVTVQCGDEIPEIVTPTATDRCDSLPRLTFLATRINGNCVGNFKTVRTWTATDACGNRSTATQEVTIIDTRPPTLFSIPANVTLNCGQPLPSGTGVGARDNCDNNVRITMNDSRNVQGCIGNVGITRTWTATDACGNTATATQLIALRDTIAPIFVSVPADLTLGCDGGLPTLVNPVVSDLCDPAPNISLHTERIDGNCPRAYKLVRTWTATDACGNSKTARQTLSVGDTEKPIFVGVPQDVTINCGGTPPLGTGVSANDNCDNNVRVIMNDVTVAGNCAGSYYIYRKWKATDACGNQAVATQTISVGDNEAPTFSNVPRGITVSCGGIVPTAVQPTLADNCDSEPRLTFNETRQEGTCAGSYTLTRTWTATDQCGNTRTATQVIVARDTTRPVLAGVPANVTVNANQIPVVASVTASDACDGVIQVAYSENRTNGTCGYTLMRTWTATDRCGNSAIGTQLITIGNDVSATYTFRNESCGDAAGSITFTPTTYNYSWSDGATGALRNDLRAGTYRVTVSSGGNCFKTFDILIENRCDCDLRPFTITKTDVNCDGTNGSATLNIVGNASDYRFTWAPNVSTTQTATHLTAGNYTVRVWKATNLACYKDTTFTISSPNRFTVAEPTIVGAGCTAQSGRATFVDGQVIYFRWSNGQTGNPLVNVGAGNYTVTITKDGACPVVKTVVIPSDNSLTARFEVIQEPSCGRMDGAVRIIATGGSGNYTYSWGEGSARYVLMAGSATITVTDNTTGCRTAVTYTLMERTVNASVVMDSIIYTSCQGISDGRVNPQIAYGTGFKQPARMEIKDASTNAVVSNGRLTVGRYVFNLMDSSGCIAFSKSFEVKDRDPMVETLVKTDATCDVKGSIRLTLAGGASPYRFDWADLTGSDDPRNRTNLNAGYYNLTITDANNCTKVLRNIQVRDNCACRPPAIDSIWVQGATCGNANAIAEIVLNGLNPANYEFEWSPAEGTPNGIGNRREGLRAGAYQVYVTVRNNPACFTVVNVGVGNQVTWVANIRPTTTPATCNAANGTARLPQADTLRYLWLMDNSQALYRTDLRKGIYQVQVTNTNNRTCPTVMNVTVGEQNNLVANTTIETKATCGQANGQATIHVLGGSGNYGYDWGVNDSTRRNLAAGVYTVSVTDNTTQCGINASFAMENGIQTPATIGMANPIVYVSCPDMRNGRVNFTVTPSTGLTVQIMDSNGRVWSNDSLAAGSYCVIAKDANQCIVGSKCFEVRNPMPIKAVVNKVNRRCPNNGVIEAGRIEMEIMGGTAPYTYRWADLQGNNQPEDRTDLLAGTYAVTITDTKGCNLKLDTLIIRSECPSDLDPRSCEKPIIGSVNVTDARCNQNDGRINLNLTNTGNFTYLWSPNVGNTATVSNLRAGTYAVTVYRDGDTLCSVKRTLVVNNNLNGCVPTPCDTPVIAKLDKINARCGQPTGRIDITMAVNGNYVYTWTNNVSTTNAAINLAAGTYRVSIKRAGDTCVLDRTIVIPNDTTGCAVTCNLSAIATAVNKNCNASGSITVTPTNGQTPYLYKWSDLATTTTVNTRTGLAQGVYNVTITDALNCVFAIRNIQVNNDCQVVCDKAYTGPTVIEVRCDSLLDLCSTIGYRYLSQYTITDNGTSATFGTGATCGTDSLRSYNYLTLTRFYPNGPYNMSAWTVNNTTFTVASVPTIRALVDSMNRWDAGGEWVLDARSLSIVGGRNGNRYGQMVFKRNGNEIARLSLNTRAVPAKVSVKVDTGSHRILFVNNENGCRDSVAVNITCRPEVYVLNSRIIDTSILIGDLDTICLNTYGDATRTTITNICASNYRNFAGYNINETTDCLNYSGISIGADTLCLRRCYPNNRCDTVTVRIRVKPRITHSDTACFTVYTGSRSLSLASCADLATICTNLNVNDTSKYTITDNGYRYSLGFPTCTTDTVFSYTYFSLAFNYPNGPYNLRSWEVNSQVYAANNIRNIFALVDSMNKWDRDGNWQLDRTAFSIKGGNTRNNYGQMQFMKNAQIIARFNPNRNFIPKEVGMRLDTGRHLLVFTNPLLNCRDSVTIQVNCPGMVTPPIVNTTFARTMYVGNRDTICLNNLQDPQFTRLTNVCLDKYQGFAIYSIDENKDCIALLGNRQGSDTLCIRRCAGNTCDTITIAIHVRPNPNQGCMTTYEGDHLLQTNDCRGTILCTSIARKDSLDYQLTINGFIRPNPFVPCSSDTVFAYSYYSLTFNYPTGPYQLGSWIVNGQTYTARVATMAALRDSMNRWDPSGNWTIDATAYSLKGGNPRSNYGNMVFKRNNLTVATVAPNRQFILKGLGIKLDTGCHQLILRNVNGCKDTVNVCVKCPPPPTGRVSSVVIDTFVYLKEYETLCFVGVHPILTTMRSLSGVRPNVTYRINDTTDCVIIRGERVGRDSIIVRRCDDVRGICDTITIRLDIRERTIVSGGPSSGVRSGFTNNDMGFTVAKTALKVAVLANDSLSKFKGSPIKIELVTQPSYGYAIINSDNTVQYKPNDADCQKRDSFYYAIHTEMGSDTAKVVIDVLCDDVVVFSGFSPNDDGFNDIFEIVGLEKYPTNKLMIFNRYGNQVYEAEPYKNDWNGRFDGKVLIDGTYFYILELGNGVKKSGYIQIHR
jgi:gliding motility-associated-like protein